MTLPKINLPLVAGLLLAAISLFFSATGLVHLFAGAGVAIVVMAGAFEVAKVASTVWLLKNWRLRLLPILIGGALLCLSGISSIGVYSYMGAAYDQGRAAATTGAGTITAVEQELTRLDGDRDRLLAQVEAIPENQGTNRRRVLAQIQPRLDALDERRDDLSGELTTLRTSQVTEEANIGELRFAADLFGVTQDDLAQAIITVLAFLLDPLALLLLLASGVKGGAAGEEETELGQALLRSMEEAVAVHEGRMEPAKVTTLVRHDDGSIERLDSALYGPEDLIPPAPDPGPVSDTLAKITRRHHEITERGRRRGRAPV